MTLGAAPLQILQSIVLPPGRAMWTTSARVALGLRPTMTVRTGTAALVAAFALAYLLPLAVRPLATPDETRYAEIPREMVANADWIVPRLDGVRYFEKPPLGYWITAASISVLGENRVAVRLPSALAAGLTALIVSGLMTRTARDGRAGLLAAAATLSMILVYVVGTLNVLDMLFASLVTATVAAFFMAAEARPVREERRWLAVAGLAAALAFLTKGFLALVLPALVAVPYLIWQRRARDILRLPWIPLVTCAIVLAPWAAAIGLRERDFWRYFVFEEHLRRFASDDAQHGRPFWFYLPVLIGGALPWIAFLPASITAARSAPDWPEPLRNLRRYAICWLLGPLLFFSVAKGKLPTYVLPCIAPLVLLIAVNLLAAPRELRARFLNPPARVLGAIVAVLIVAATIVLEWPPAELVEREASLPYETGEVWKGVALAATAVSWTMMLFAAAGLRSFAGKVALISAGPVPLLIATLFAAPAAEAHKLPGPELRRLAAEVPADPILVSDCELVHAVCWAFGRDDVVLLGIAGEMDYGTARPDPGDRLVKRKQVRKQIRDRSRERPMIIIVRTKQLHGLPEPDWARRFGDAHALVYERRGRRNDDDARDTVASVVEEDDD